MLFIISECKGGVERYIQSVNKNINSIIYIPTYCGPLQRIIRSLLIILFVYKSYLSYYKNNKIIFYFNSTFAGFFGRIAAFPLRFLDRNVVVIYSPHGWYFNVKAYFKIIEKFLCLITDKIILSDSSELIQANFLKESNLVSINNNFVENDLYENIKIYDIIFVGRNCYQKGVDRLSKIINNPHNLNLKFFICTDSKIKDIIESKNVTFGYNLDHESLITKISQSRFLISCSRYEGMPYVILDALSQGVPILLPDNLKFDNLFNGFNMYYYDDVDISLIFGLNDLTYQKLSFNAYHTYLEHYSLNSTLPNLRKIIES